ncbi:hypothetical protein RFI_16137 [Reticulomyxa filosa]|uniref:Kelch motif family protein n=1 Tax=Reticulomyxa filosa TaxID=46433 RepID=X6N455_RETFI|nr:hypothetical protein RFI_16137 [Reticulomyxa filosa]|eukprot:ETO21065.1 hypothetical protein RFI_16137 [Reticulomyxa filosa]
MLQRKVIIVCNLQIFLLQSYQQERSTNMDVRSFETLASLPIPLRLTQCVVHKHEILICGGAYEKDCYSYHILKNEYKYICSYPDGVELNGHCVMKYVHNNNSNAITLLSFGGEGKYMEKHTLVMNYVSVWDDNGKEGLMNIAKTNRCNEWIPFTNKANKPIYIGREQDEYRGARAVISGSNNHLLFITSFPNNIDVFDLNTLQFLKQDIVPSEPDNWTKYHCFLSKTDNELSTIKTNKRIYELLLFCKNTGLLIQYNEESNTFQFHKLRVCTNIKPLYSYGYIYIKDFVLFFGGDGYEICDSKEVHKYLTTENKWAKFEHTLPISLTDCVVILSEDSKYIHIIGGCSGTKTVATHFKAKVSEWMKEETEAEKEWMLEENEKKEIEEIKRELEEIEEDLDSKKLKVKLKVFNYYFCDNIL